MTDSQDRISPDQLPGQFENRVFIGGHYDDIVNLRRIRRVVEELGFDTALPYDDFDLPLDQIYDWDMRILHQCKYAIFDISQEGGQIFEITRARDYQTITLLLAQFRDPYADPDEVDVVGTMFRQSGHPVRTYSSDEELEDRVRNFLAGESSLKLFEAAEEAQGLTIDFEEAIFRAGKTGVDEHEFSYEGIKSSGDRPVTEISHDFWFDGEITNLDFEPLSEHDLEWSRDSSIEGTSLREQGTVDIRDGLERGDDPISYKFTIQTKGAFALEKDNLPDPGGDQLLMEGREYVSRDMLYPVNKLLLKIESSPSYLNDPAPGVFNGGVKDQMASLEDNFTASDGSATLKIRRPKIFHNYRISWEVPE